MSLANATHAGPYLIIDRLNTPHSSFGEIYVVSKGGGNTKYALKLLTTFDQIEVDRFGIEVEILHHLKTHPYVIEPKTNLITDTVGTYYVMELADGELASMVYNDTSLSTSDRIGVFKKVCEALAHCRSRRVVHRDLHSGNVLASRVGNDLIPKLVDFGRGKNFG